MTQYRHHSIIILYFPFLTLLLYTSFFFPIFFLFCFLFHFPVTPLLISFAPPSPSLQLGGRPFSLSLSLSFLSLHQTRRRQNRTQLRLKKRESKKHMNSRSRMNERKQELVVLMSPALEVHDGSQTSVNGSLLTSGR